MATLINDLTGNTKKFAEACFDSGTDELAEALNGEADPADCKEWDITDAEWREAIQAAVNEKSA